MKVGIVTIYGDNIGNKLQNYALQCLIESLGYEAETICVINGFNLASDQPGPLVKISPKRIIMSIVTRFKNTFPYKNQRDGIYRTIKFHRQGTDGFLEKKRSLAFRAFSEKYIIRSKYVIDASEAKWQCRNSEIDEEYDAFIVGSDQVWNRTKSPYFLTFTSNEKKIAFAPSFGIGVLPECVKPVYQKWLNEIPHLSVREERGAEIIRELTGRDAPVLPDPTLCLPREEWEKIESRPTFADGDFILTYFLGNEINRYRRHIEAYARKNNLRIINLLDMREPEYYAVDPSEFVWLIHHAKAMFTDSFHGTVFSLIFHTPFLVFDRIESGGTSMSSRIETLLKNFGLQDRQYNTEEIDRIDFSNADRVINEQREKANEFLYNVLENIRNNDKTV